MQHFENLLQCVLKIDCSVSKWEIVRDVAKILLLCGWGVRLKLPEFTCIVSCSVSPNHYLLKYHKTMLFGYLHVVGAGGQLWLSETLTVIDILSYLL